MALGDTDAMIDKAGAAAPRGVRHLSMRTCRRPRTHPLGTRIGLALALSRTGGRPERMASVEEFGESTTRSPVTAVGQDPRPAGTGRHGRARPTQKAQGTTAPPRAAGAS